jgi:hypothetical protein
MENRAKKRSVRNENVWSLLPTRSKVREPIASSPRASSNISTPRTTATRTSGPIFQLSGVGDGQT